jgi:hypothetical protein
MTLTVNNVNFGKKNNEKTINFISSFPFAGMWNVYNI